MLRANTSNADAKQANRRENQKRRKGVFRSNSKETPMPGSSKPRDLSISVKGGGRGKSCHISGIRGARRP